MGERGWGDGRRCSTLVVAKICLPSNWSHISRLRKCLVEGRGPCRRLGQALGGWACGRTGIGIEFFWYGVHMSVEVAAAVSPWRRRGPWHAGRHGRSCRSSRQVSHLRSSGTEWPACAGQPSSRPGVQLTGDARCWRKSSQFPSFCSICPGIWPSFSSCVTILLHVVVVICRSAGLPRKRWSPSPVHVRQAQAAHPTWSTIGQCPWLRFEAPVQGGTAEAQTHCRVRKAASRLGLFLECACASTTYVGAVIDGPIVVLLSS